MKYAYHEYYVEQDGRYVGAGALIEEDVNKLFEQKRSKQYQLSRKGGMQRLAQGCLPHLKKVRFNGLHELLEAVSSVKGADVSTLSSVLGPLGANNFKKNENGVYVCDSFVFDKAWFEEQLQKVQTLHNAFTYYMGRIEETPPKSYRNAEDALKEHLLQVGKESPNASYEVWQEQATSRLTPNERRLLKELETNRDHICENVVVGAHRDTASTEKLLSALSDCMDNVRTVMTQGRKWDKELRVEYVPLNIFGVYVIDVLDAYKKDLHPTTCAKCEQPFFVKARSGGICDKCLLARRQRKLNVKRDIEKGKSLEDIIKSRRTSPEELTELYNEIVQEAAAK